MFSYMFVIEAAPWEVNDVLGQITDEFPRLWYIEAKDRDGETTVTMTWSDVRAMDWDKHLIESRIKELVK